MQAELEAYGKKIKDKNQAELYEECMKLKEENIKLRAREAEYRKGEPALAREYDRLKKELTKIKEERDTLKNDYKKVCEQNVILVNNRFASHNEKTGTIRNIFSEDLEDPLSEDAPEPSEKTGADNKPRDNDARDGKVIKFREKDPVWSSVKERLKQPRENKKTAHDYSNLPHTDNYILDTDKYDSEYGEGNWEIAAWHTKELLHHIPSEYYVEERHVPVIKQLDTNELKSQPMPGVMMPYSSATESTVAHMMYQKFFMCSATYRQEMDLENHGVTLSRQTMSNWMMRFAEERLSVAYEHGKRTLRTYSYQQGDETTYLVIHDLEDGAISGSKDYVWAHMSSELDDSVHPIVIYCFELSRSTEHLRDFYRGVSGVNIACDAYVSYPTLEKESGGRIKVSGCFDHARRRLVDAFKIIYRKGMSAETVEELIEMKAIVLINRIYMEEFKLSGLSASERLEKRKRLVKRHVDAYFEFMRSIDLADPALSYKMKDAVTYSLNQEKYLRRFLEDGRIPMTNAACERIIKPIALLRRNSLFFNTARGANAGMIIHSLVETARKNAANPELYLQYVLEEALNYKDITDNSKLDELMPWSEKYKTWEREKLSNSRTFTLRSNAKPYYKPAAKEKLQKDYSAAG